MVVERPRTLEEVCARAGDAEWPDAIMGIKAVQEARELAKRNKVPGMRSMSFTQIRRLATRIQEGESALRRLENGR